MSLSHLIPSINPQSSGCEFINFVDFIISCILVFLLTFVHNGLLQSAYCSVVKQPLNRLMWNHLPFPLQFVKIPDDVESKSFDINEDNLVCFSGLQSVLATQHEVIFSTHLSLFVVGFFSLFMRLVFSLFFCVSNASK